MAEFGRSPDPTPPAQAGPPRADHQMDFVYLRGRRLHHIPQQSVPVLGHSHSLCPLLQSLGTIGKNLALSSLLPPCRWDPPKPSLAQHGQPQLSQPFLLEEKFQFSIFVTLHRTLPECPCLSCTGEPALDYAPGVASLVLSREDHLPQPAGNIPNVSMMQDTIGLGCKSTFLVHIQHLVPAGILRCSSPSHHDWPKIIESGIAVTSAASALVGPSHHSPWMDGGSFCCKCSLTKSKE